MASGLIYLIIIGMWVAYFLPRWMRQHETQSGREGERYKSAMKIVASTPNFPDPVDQEKKSKVLQTRRTILAALTFGFVAFLIAIVAGFIPAIAILIPLTGFAIFVINVRRQVVAAQIKKRRLAALATIAAVEIKNDPRARIDLSQRSRSQSEEVLDQWIPLSERVTSSTITIIEKDEDRSWSPIAVPKPTYATAPKAFTPKRTVDLTTPGKWSAEQERLAALEVPSKDELFDQELAEQAARPANWAVNQ